MSHYWRFNDAHYYVTEIWSVGLDKSDPIQKSKRLGKMYAKKSHIIHILNHNTHTLLIALNTQMLLFWGCGRIYMVLQNLIFVKSNITCTLTNYWKKTCGKDCHQGKLSHIVYNLRHGVLGYEEIKVKLFSLHKKDSLPPNIVPGGVTHVPG